MQIAVLGPLEAHGPGGPVPLGGPRERAVLAVLALRAGTVVSADALIDAVWGDEPPASAAKNIQTYVSQIRRRLRPAELIRSVGGGYSMTHVDLDVTRFEGLVRQARAAMTSGAPSEAAPSLSEGLALWRGEPLADLRSSPVLAAEATRLRELRKTALELQAEAELALGRHVDVVAQVQRLLAEDPLHERLWALLMTALYRCGRQADALAAYRNARQVLIRELGIEPGPDLQRLEQQVLGHDPELASPPLAPEHVADAGAAPLPSALAEAATSPLLTRSAELAELEEAWSAAAAGVPGLVLLAGEPGIGKTRLATALAQQVHDAGARVLYGRCDPEGLIPYQPVIEALRAYVADAPLSDLRAHLHETDGQLRRILPELARRLPDLVAHLPAPGDDRLLLFDAVASLLATAARKRPLLVVVDDVHWADGATLLLLRHLLRMSHTRLLVVATYRDTDVHVANALAENLALLRREPAVRRIALGGLSRAAVVELTEQAGLPVPSAPLAARIHAETRGNPLFVHEVLRHLATEPGEASELVTSPLPEGVREVIGRRLASLAERTNLVLAVAALVGREFEVDVVAAAAELDEDVVLECLDEAVAARLLVAVRSHPDRYGFPHALVRATLVDGLSPGRRVRLHDRIASVLERLDAATPGAHLVELAHHLGEAAQRDDIPRAVEYSRRAGDLAMEQLAYEDAERFYRRALELLALVEERDQLQRCELLLALGNALSRVHQGRARTVLLDAADVARRAGSPEHLARAAVAASCMTAFERRDAPEVQLLDEAQSVLPGNHHLLPDVLAAKSIALSLVEDSDVLLPLSRRAIGLAQAMRDSAAHARAVAAHLMVLAQPDQADERLALADDLLDRAESLRDLSLLAFAQRQRAWAHLDRGSFSAARAAVDAHRALARRTRHPIAVAVDGCYEAMFAILEGRFDDAELLIPRLREDQANVAGFAATHRAFLFTLRWLQGRVVELEPEALALAQRFPEVLPFRSELAVVAAAAGRTEQAACLLDGLSPGASRIPRSTMWPAVVLHLALAVPLLEDAVRAQELYDLLHPLADRNLTVAGRLFNGATAFHLGRLAAAAGDAEAAELHLQDALRRHREYGAVAWVSVTEDALRQLSATPVRR